VGAKDKRILGIHFGLVLAELICISGFSVELYRALAGNALSWAYVFEWPLFGGYAVYMWRRLWREEVGVSHPRTGSNSATTLDSLAAYNEYLRSVHEHDGNGRADGNGARLNQEIERLF
jgi:hypothetical protein